MWIHMNMLLFTISYIYLHSDFLQQIADKSSRKTAMQIWQLSVLVQHLLTNIK